MATVSSSMPAVARDRNRDRAIIRAWLYLVAFLIIAMVVVGGATRLTESGLSITEWQPVHGVIPPLDDAAWQEEFAKYQQIPEYQLINEGMSLDQFKAIYWWEWAHRLLGRLIGFVVLLPLIALWATGCIEKRVLPKLIAIFVLGGLQGVVGWWMVVSGLTERTDVSQYRLAIHLTLACIILAYVMWVARSLAPGGGENASAPMRRVAGLIVLLVVIQIFLGGLVAGLDAGLTYNTWPLMDGHLIPFGLLIRSPAWLNFFENVATVQFDHRVGAYVLFVVALLHAFQAQATAHGNRAWLLAALITAQAALGIAVLIMVVPLPLALLHQLGAVVVLTVAVVHLRAMTPPLPIEPAPVAQPQ